MALAFDNSSLGHSSSSPITVSHTCAGNNRILIVGIGFDDGSAAAGVTAITYAGLALSKIGASAYQSNKKTEIWYLIDPPTGANNIIVTFSAAPTMALASGLSYSASALPNPMAESSIKVGTAATATTAIITNADNDWMVVFLTEDNTTTPAVHAGTTQRQLDTTSDGFGVCFMSGDTNGVIHPAGSQTLGWDLGGVGNWAIAAACIRPDVSSGRIILQKLRPRAFAPGIAR